MAEVRQLETSTGPIEAAQDPISEARQLALVKMAGLLFDQAEETNPDEQASKRTFNALTRGTGGLSLVQSEKTRILLHLGQAIDSQTKGEEAQAIDELERTLEAGLHHPAALFDLGLLLFPKDAQKALRHFQEAVKHPSFALASYLMIGKICYDADSLADAAVAYLQALRLADSETVSEADADELRQLYEPILESQSRQTDPAVFKALCESIHNQLMRSDWRVYLKMARQQLPPQAAGSPPMPLAEMMLETRSGHVVELLAQVRSLAKQNKLFSAMEEAYHALGYAPTYLPLHIQIAELLLQGGYSRLAIEKLLPVAELYALRGEADQAIRLLHHVLEFAPMELPVHTRLIELLLTQGKTDAAIQQYIALAEIYYQLAEMDLTRQTYTNALKVAQQSRGSRPMIVQILYKIADIDMQRLDLRNAMRIYEQIRTLEPEDVHARARLVELNYRMGQENAALSEIDTFLALLENGSKRAKAAEFLKEVLSEQPDRLDLHVRLAELYQRDGKRAEAVQAWEELIRQSVSSGDRPMVITALKAVIALNPPNQALYQKQLAQIQRQS
jgi:tetratricopeptide (TPR) repeat protein